MLTLVTIILILSIVNIFEGKNVTVNTILGDIIGQQMDGFVLFKGIPYTEYVPIGDRRFTESVVRTSVFSNNPYIALDFSSSCIQPPPLKPSS